LGFNVSFPLTENNPYDFVIERAGSCSLVQVKGSQNQKSEGVYEVDLRSSSGSHRKVMDPNLFDYLVVVTPEDTYVIPADEVGGNVTLRVNRKGKYSQYLH
jgi:hypothetical protein